VQVKLWDPLRTRAIPERLRGAFTTRRYTNPRLPLPLPYLYLTCWLAAGDGALKRLQVQISKTSRVRLQHVQYLLHQNREWSETIIESENCHRKRKVSSTRAVEQVAQLSQRDRAARWVSFGQKWKTMAKDGRRYSSDIICLLSTTVTYSASKAITFREITQNKRYYAVEGHSRSPMWLTLTDILSPTVSKLSQMIFYENRPLCVFEPPFEGLRGNLRCSS